MKWFQKIFTKKSRTPQDGIFYDNISLIVGYNPTNIAIYKEAFSHSSAGRLNTDGHLINYERLEYLGDAVLGMAAAAYLYKNAPNRAEGYLTKMRSKIVSRNNLNKIGKKLALLDLLDCTVNPVDFGDNIYGNLFESLIGAMYSEKGYDFTEKFIYVNLIKPLEPLEDLEEKIISYKSTFIEHCQKKKKDFHFDIQEEESKEENKHFVVKLHYEQKVISKGRATSKKKAEEQAAKRAYYSLQSQKSYVNKK